MRDEQLYLKPNVRIEGLVNQFCAWLHVFAPVPAAMNMANLHLPMLDSYIEQPQVHADAVANPKMKGSFFIDVDTARVEEIRALRDAIKAENGAALELADAVGKADNLLRTQATGYDLTPLYAQLPANLLGLVELVYDINNNPQLRFVEPLLYRSPYYLPARQSIDLSLDEGTVPPFALSTPRLPDATHLQLPLPLNHPAIDEFFGLREKPRTFAQIREVLEIDDAAAADRLRPLLAPDPYVVRDRSVESGGRIRYFGHACLLLQSPHVSIMVDPFISSFVAAGDRYTYADLPDHIDYVLLTHGHQDHIVVETLLQIRRKVGVVVVPRNGGGHRQDPSLRLFLEHLGFTVREVDDFTEIPFVGGRIVATPFLGEHCDLDIRAKSTYWVSLAGRTVFLGADSSGLDTRLYANIRDMLGSADLGFIGMECDGAPLTWLYNSLFTQPVPRKMSITRKLSGSNAAQACGIVRELGINEAFIYAMGQEDWLQHIMATSYTPDCYQLQQVAEFLESCPSLGVHAEHLLVRKEIRW
jgi:L-ascorbate metabolism protein UlaG (beta-lactamase superfamily)